MKKIPNLFARDENGDLTEEINPECQWVADGSGYATRKYDGTSCKAIDGELWKRRMVKPGKPEPPSFVGCTFDEITGKTYGWVPVEPTDKWHQEALADRNTELLDGWTYELCGPKVQSNPEGFERHQLVPHGTYIFNEAPRTRPELVEWLKDRDIEGLVWWNEDGRKCKLRKGDLGLER
jgi:hypothetical protein